MVIGHCGAPFTPWIFLFHMAVFYIAFGYCWNDKHIASFDSVKLYIWNKVKSLYLPFIFCNIVYLLFNNVFVETGIYASTPDFLALIGSDDQSLLHESFTIVQILRQAFLICILFGSTELGGPTWFFASLLVTSTFYILLRFLLRQYFSIKVSTCIEILVACSFLLIAWFISESKLNFHNSYINRLFESYLLLLLGVHLKTFDKKFKEPKRGLLVLIFVSAFSLLYYLNGLGSISMARCAITNPMFFLLASIAGWYLLWSVSKLCSFRWLSYLGARTRAIVMWHFISFKAVSYLYLIIVGGNMLLLGCFPYIKSAPDYMWIIYSVIGICLPCIIGAIYKN